MVGFTSDMLLQLGTIGLPVTAKVGDRQVTRVVDFLVVACPFAYNAILGRLVLNQLRTVTSTYHLLMRFPPKGRIREVRRD